MPPINKRLDWILFTCAGLFILLGVIGQMRGDNRSFAFQNPGWVGRIPAASDPTAPPTGGSYDLLAGWDPDQGVKFSSGTLVEDWTNYWGSMTAVLTNKSATGSHHPDYRASDTGFNNKGTFTYYGTGTYLTLTNDSVNTWGVHPYTVYVVAMMTNVVNGTTVVDGGTAHALRLQWRSTAPGRLYMQNNTTDQMGVLYTNSVTIHAGVYYPNAGNEYYVSESNGDAAVTKGPSLTGENTTDPDGFTVGSIGGFTRSSPFGGRVGRIYVYRGAHDQTQRDAVIASLNAYYAVF